MVLETGDVSYEVLPINARLAHHVQFALHVLTDHLANLQGEAVVPNKLRLQVVLVPSRLGLVAGRAELDLPVGLGRLLTDDDRLDQLLVVLDVAVDQVAFLLIALVCLVRNQAHVLILFFLLSVRLELDLDLAVPGGAMDGLAEHVEDDLLDSVLVACDYQVVRAVTEEHRLDRLRPEVRVQHPDQHSTYVVQRNRRHERLKDSFLNHVEIEEVLGLDRGKLRGV